MRRACLLTLPRSDGRSRNREIMKNIQKPVLILCLGGCLLISSCNSPSDKRNEHQKANLKGQAFTNRAESDHFLSALSSSGVIEVARQIGFDFDKYLLPIVQDTNHCYRRYRWSVGHHENGGVMISALPPEEEVGWTPWERWYKDKNGLTRKETWVMYPLKNPGHHGVARWYKLDENDITPRYLKKPMSLENQLRLARIYEAASVLGFDAEEVLLRPLSSAATAYYQQCRWVVVPHILGADAPVIYILPPVNRTDEWPWESWYTDGKVKLIHHVHYTKENDKTKASWKEYPGAPQRPPEIFGVLWYWYDDKTLKPTMADF